MPAGLAFVSQEMVGMISFFIKKKFTQIKTPFIRFYIADFLSICFSKSPGRNYLYTDKSIS